MRYKVIVADLIHEWIENAMQYWLQDTKLFVASIRLLEDVERILFTEDSCPITDMANTIVAAYRRLVLSDLSILHRWNDTLCARAAKCYAKVKKTLFVEAW